ncbi:hypothetical protein D3C72_1369190 [compost metagenome]
MDNILDDLPGLCFYCYGIEGGFLLYGQHELHGFGTGVVFGEFGEAGDDTAFHLAYGLVGKGDGEDVPVGVVFGRHEEYLQVFFYEGKGFS